VSKFELPETQFERTVKDKIAGKSILNEKINVLSTFWEFSLNFLFDSMKKDYKFGTVREKSGVKVWIKESQWQNRL